MLPAASFWKFSRMLRSSLLLAAMVASRSGRRPKRRPVVDPVELGQNTALDGSCHRRVRTHAHMCDRLCQSASVTSTVSISGPPR